MKLDAHEIYEIEKYLLEQDLISLEFYNEMLDHFINAITDYKSGGITFKDALFLTQSAFKSISFSQDLGFVKYQGLKALEVSHYDKLAKKIKTKRMWAPLALLKSKNGLFWLMGFPVCFFIALEFGTYWLFLAALLGSFIFWINIFSLYKKAGTLSLYRGFGRWYRFMISSLPRRKSIQLKPNYSLFLVFKNLKMSIVIIPSLVYLFITDLEKQPLSLGWNMQTCQVILAFIYFLILVDYWQQFKAEYRKISSTQPNIQ